MTASTELVGQGETAGAALDDLAHKLRVRQAEEDLGWPTRADYERHVAQAGGARGVGVRA